MQTLQHRRDALYHALRGKVVVSCQASPGEPFDHPEALARMAQAVLLGGAGGLRAEGAQNVASFRRLTPLPLLGLSKSLDAQGMTYITRSFAEAEALCRAGADIVALDCTRRRLVEAEPWPSLLARIQAELQRPACADIADLGDAAAAEAAGADFLATTLRGYTADTAAVSAVDWGFLEALVRQSTRPVILEGHVRRPEEVSRAFALGVHTVVVGSAITRPHLITAGFVAAAYDDAGTRNRAR